MGSQAFCEHDLQTLTNVSIFHQFQATKRVVRLKISFWSCLDAHCVTSVKHQNGTSQELLHAVPTVNICSSNILLKNDLILSGSALDDAGHPLSVYLYTCDITGSCMVSFLMSHAWIGKQSNCCSFIAQTTSASSDSSLSSVTSSGSLDKPSALPCLAVGLYWTT